MPDGDLHMKRKAKKAFSITAAAVFLAAVLYLVWCVLLNDSVIWKNVQVNGISIQGKTKAQAREAILADFKETYEDKAIQVNLSDEVYQAYIFPMLGIDPGEVVEQAYQLGHGAWYKRGLDRIRLMTDDNAEEITLLPQVTHPETVSSVISYMEIEKVDTVVQPVCRITDDSLIIKKGKTGIKADTDALKEQLLHAAASLDLDTQIQCATISVTPEEPDFKAYYRQIYQEPEDAYMDEKNDYEIVPSKTGISFDVAKAVKEYRQAKEGSVFTVAFEQILPEVTTGDLTSRVFRDVLGSYNTYGGGTDNRITNLTLAAKAIDGIELMPGETFSYNETLGERTAERGYKAAGVFVNGQHAEGIGGGICQVSTTLFDACLYADLEIVKRTNHSGRVDYVPAGLDAAVSWGDPDFQFCNNTEYPIRISATYADGSVNVKIYGTKTNSNTVKVTTQQLDAQSYKTYRHVYDQDGNLLETEEICSSHYIS